MRLKRKEVFIVFYDVDNYDPVNNLVGRRDWFKPGSKILITTRDKQVLGTKVDRDAIYERKDLDSNEAFKLFSSHAFGKDCPVPHSKLGRLAKKVTHRAKGNPLALIHLGNSAVSGKEDPEAWESLLENLQKSPDPHINGALKLSLERLDEAEREFLGYRMSFNCSR
ncbi:disease resistance protein RPP4-like [Neltuma alba]|uniref:disease resistance protein RPP4-like n=1 Tax=Neltuma alba TaxID=207710 RepID=UPI0010A3DA01|nr:disease resistance protein RPP4-like [Prosopis alba]